MSIESNYNAIIKCIILKSFLDYWYESGVHRWVTLHYICNFWTQTHLRIELCRQPNTVSVGNILLCLLSLSPLPGTITPTRVLLHYGPKPLPPSPLLWFWPCNSCWTLLFYQPWPQPTGLNVHTSLKLGHSYFLYLVFRIRVKTFYAVKLCFP